MTELQEIIRVYRNALRAFAACPDTVRSDPIPPESQRICNYYFAARERLLQVTSASDDPLAQAWALAFTAAEECPKLNLAGRDDEAARRMKVYNAAEVALLTRSDDG